MASIANSRIDVRGGPSGISYDKAPDLAARRLRRFTSRGRLVSLVANFGVEVTVRRNVSGVGIGSTLVLLAILLSGSRVYAQSGIISDVRISGNQRVEADAIK